MVKQEIANVTYATANTAITCKITAYKCGLDLTFEDQVTYIRSVYGKNKLDEFGNKLSSIYQLLAYLDSQPDVSYLAVTNKLETSY